MLLYAFWFVLTVCGEFADSDPEMQRGREEESRSGRACFTERYNHPQHVQARVDLSMCTHIYLYVYIYIYYVSMYKHFDV